MPPNESPKSATPARRARGHAREGGSHIGRRGDLLVITLDALRGHVLEEHLARLLRSNGYHLLVSERQDPDALKRGAHGLLVRGRGTDHQADVLGELARPAPFSLPLRIFVEAKYRSSKANLRDVRNAHGVIHDVNEQYGTASAGSRRIPMRRHHYRYALFSVSGFTRPAQQYALAQQISLVDLSSPAFTSLLTAVDRTARELHSLAEQSGISTFPRGQVRTALRLALDTWTADGHDIQFDVKRADQTALRGQWANELNPATREPQRLPDESLARIADDLADDSDYDLILGFPAAPFVLVLRPDDPRRFRDYLERKSSDILVNIATGPRDEIVGDWAITPVDEEGGFQLHFALPTQLEDWLLRADGAAALRARQVKSALLSSITFFYGDRLVRLLFQPRRRG
ncbi:restriction endonuclease [Amycolatopsis sp. TNS106]|uniref:restriction endonuclease n=1 Tax=Amycolatopsis sp. TNS106 TaxID=2861750 RepID=UPI0021076F9D|nr:restriction endonuclease [Amycolatopsis sp. TNS106]